jgi:hypothetical protein
VEALCSAVKRTSLTYKSIGIRLSSRDCCFGASDRRKPAVDAERTDKEWHKTLSIRREGAHAALDVAVHPIFHNLRWTNFHCWAHSRTFGLTIAYEQSAHRSARSKISVQWWFRILKDRHSRRYDNKLIPRRANRLADDRNVGRSRGRLCQLLCSQFVISRPYRVWLSVWQCCRQ